MTTRECVNRVVTSGHVRKMAVTPCDQPAVRENPMLHAPFNDQCVIDAELL